MTESSIPISAYAAQQGISERQILKRITIGELPGYQTQGVWYVKIKTELPEHNIKLTEPIPVLEYANQTGIPITTILEEIASGKTPGFHFQGIWYIGNQNTHKSTISHPTVKTYGHSRGYRYWFLTIGLLLSIPLSIGIWYFQPKPQLATLILNAQIKDHRNNLQPVLNQTFYLATKRLEDIAHDYLQDLANSAELEQIDIVRGTPKWLNLVASSTALRSLLFDLSSRSNSTNVWELQQNFEKSKPLWQRYVTHTANTNKSGQAKFIDVTPGKYWVLGWIKTHTGFGFWEYEIILYENTNMLRLTSENSLIRFQDGK